MAVQFDPIAKDESLNTTESPSRNIADVLAQGLSSIASAMTPAIASYILTCPTTGYTSGSYTIFGVTKTLYRISINRDTGNNPLSDFHSGMKEDIPLQISGNQSDFSKLYAHEIGEGEVTLYFTSAPSSAFNVMIREAV